MLTEAQSGFSPGQSTMDMMYLVRRLEGLAKENDFPGYMSLIDLRKAYNSVDRFNLWKVHPRRDSFPSFTSSMT